MPPLFLDAEEFDILPGVRDHLRDAVALDRLAAERDDEHPGDIRVRRVADQRRAGLLDIVTDLRAAMLMSDKDALRHLLRDALHDGIRADDRRNNDHMIAHPGAPVVRGDSP